ncbi:hypothetical protein [Kitasatospora nipponensis]
MSEAHPEDLPAKTPAELRTALTERGPVRRLTNPDLWDAITTAILRQVVQAGSAKTKYRRWTTSYGISYASAAGTVHTVPSPAVVLQLSDDSFDAVGVAFNRKKLRSAATDYAERGDGWHDLPAAELVTALTTVSGIGPWSARAAAADYTGDYSVYPHSDLAVRTWARKAAPGVQWPEDDKVFGAEWEASAGSARQLHTLTSLTLAWGIHAPCPAGQSA